MAKHLILVSTFFSLLWVNSTLQAQTKQTNAQKLIIRFDAALKTDQVAALLRDENIETYEALVPSLNLYLVTFKRPTSSKTFLKTFAGQSGIVKYAQPDHPVKLRQSPNDPELKSQWSINGISSRGDIEATKAWELGTGGKDTAGNEIVVAVVDGGTDISHKDLQKNIWVNKGEIPDNGIDDDKNGYIDDINGWNAIDDKGTLPTDKHDSGYMHGTHVAGIIGAEGNNNLQVSGINWNTKIMPVAGSSGETSVVARAYGYVLAQKKLWLESHGKKGANIVATNSSFGVDNADCSSPDYSVWNDLYTEMGNVGIVSVVATSNSDVDVDSVGDVPSACESPYIISVTNTDSNDDKYAEGAGYGAKHVHLGAPGTDILSTVPDNKTR
ncbi:MAG: hypothetical protein EBZ49_07270, partial [Proteobacteria bacterium]|nr:hypothetical protein [Pseudomonadota bacterium]